MFPYVFDVVAASPPPIGVATVEGGRRKAAGRALWRRPKAASIMGDGEAATIAKTYANMYQIFAYWYISPIFLYSLHWTPGAI